MITQIEGRLVEKNPVFAVIDCNGVGYLIRISLHTFSRMEKAAAGSTCLLYTHLAVKEDAHTLYGFADPQERELFRLLISVSGVGPATAQLMLSSLAPEELRKAIAGANAALLQSIKGIGTKTAQRIIIDLKDKVTQTGPGYSGAESLTHALAGNKIKDDALSALMTLGFPRNNADKAMGRVLREVQTTMSVEELVKQAMKYL